MPPERFRLPRRRPRLKVEWGEYEWSMFLPDPDDPLVIATFADASCLALDVVDLPVRREIVVLLAEGCDNREIAGRLGVSPATVKSHLVRIYGKLGAADRREAVGRAVEFGILG